MSTQVLMDEKKRKRRQLHGNLLSWGAGASLGIAVLMIIALLSFIFVRGFGALWPQPIFRIATASGEEYLALIHGVESMEKQVGEQGAAEQALANQGELPMRFLLRVGNKELYPADFVWVPEAEISETSQPDRAVYIERQEWGPFIGFLGSMNIKGEVKALEGDKALQLLHDQMTLAEKRLQRIEHIEKGVIGQINAELEKKRLAIRGLQLEGKLETEQGLDKKDELEGRIAELETEYEGIAAELADLRARDQQFQVTFETLEGRETTIPISEVVRIHQPNRLSWFGKLGVYLDRIVEFIFGQPREANSEGGVAPAIFGTVLMTLLMVLAVVPLGIMAALYLHEYAKQGPVVSAVRIAVNNLAGVPSIVFGVFGLGFFCYTIGGTIDKIWFPERLPTPTFGGGGILWASLTLALLTVPVVIVATEEALVSVSKGLREASLACGASKLQTVLKVVLPAATPGIITGTILAMARGAGEVAPLMITGVVKLAPQLPLDAVPPFLHLERRFMHLGFHIYDVGFQSPNVEAAKPMVFMTTLLLIGIVLFLNLAAIRIRSRLRDRFAGAKV